MKKLIVRVGLILGERLVGVITLAALGLLAGGIAMKTDVATAMIVIGAVLLLDVAFEGYMVLRRQGPA
jgi:hypothetical protein